ncbi:carbon-nitrogen hydrolase family protein [Solicola sp. PLA-1-18]|uniref:carbon-nitrogen hydrolase family protein n=1 Tax=Solicola sp. PLA-1-18 TaxID=3380532 RepID=UPI003B7BC993
MTPAPLTVGALQVAVREPGDLAVQAEAAVGFVEQAVARGARLAVLPELYLCGYDLDVVTRPGVALDAAALAGGGLDADDSPLRSLVLASRRHPVAVLAGAAVRHRDGRLTISTLLVRDGSVRLAYDKQHLDGDEQAVFDHGDGGALLDVDGWGVGLGVCYDVLFPEHARASAEAGALVYAASMAYRTGAEHRRDLAVRARALDNGLWVVASGLVGDSGIGTVSGGSAVVDPEGRVVDAVPDGEEGVVVATLDADLVAATRAAHAMGADRRADLGTVRRL